MSDVIKSGNLFKYSDTVFNTKWKYNYVELLKNSTLRWFENKADRAPKRSIILKDVCSFLAFGDIVKQLPFKPDVKEDQINLLIAIPHDNIRTTRLSFFLCNNQTEMQEWVNSILSSIADQNKSQQAPPPSQEQRNVPTNTYPLGQPNIGYAGVPPNVGAHYPAAPLNTGSSYPAGSYPISQTNMMGSNQGGQPTAMPPYQGAPTPYSGGPSSGPPPIGFNIGGAPVGPYSQAPQTYPSASYPQQAPINYPTSYNPQYPVQQRPYAPAAVAAPSQTYMPGNPPVQYGGQVGGQPAQTYVIVDGKKRKKKSKLKNAAIGLAAGAAGMYATHKLFNGYGHGWGGGWGGHHGYYDHGYGGHHGYYDHGWGGHHGSWSSLSSYDSWSD